MVMENIKRMVIYILVILLKISFMEMVKCFGKMVWSIKDNGKMVEWMAMVRLSMKITVNIRGVFSTINVKEEEYIHLWMEELGVVIG